MFKSVQLGLRAVTDSPQELADSASCGLTAAYPCKIFHLDTVMRSSTEWTNVARIAILPAFVYPPLNVVFRGLLPECPV